MTILDGKKLSKEILEQVKREVAALSFQPIFCDVLVGDDSSSVQYVKMKAKTAQSVGIKFLNANFSKFITTAELIKEIQILNKIPHMCGIIIQLPLPEHIDKQMVLDSIEPSLDVDCLGKVASEKFYRGFTAGMIGFPTALACMAVLESMHLDSNPSTPFDKTQDKSLRTRNIVILGQGMLVGKPVTALLQVNGFSPVVIDSTTRNKEEITKEADVIISAIGQAKYISGKMLKKGVILIDAGASEDFGSIVGDVDLDSVKDVASFVSPVPGGVGPVTVAMLLNNVLTVAKAKNLPHP